MTARAALALAVALLVVGCPKRDVADADAPTPPTPLERALVLAGASADLSLPHADEAGYTIPTRYPVIDRVLAQPLAAGPWADALGARLDAAGVDASQLAAQLAVLSPGGGAPSTAAPSAEPEGWTRSELPSPTTALTSPRGRIRTEHLEPLVVEALVDLAGRLEAAHRASGSWSSLGEMPTPPRPPEEYFIDPRTGRYRFRTHPVGVQLEFLPTATSLDHAAMTDAAVGLLEAARTWAARIREAQEPTAAEKRKAKRNPPPPPAESGPVLHLQTSLGDIVVGGLGPDRHSGDALLVLDLGGDDVWTNNAGSNFGVPSTAALAIDLGGSDRYQSKRPHAQGAGFSGIGVLLDAGADPDGYFADVHAQGAGFYGVGILWDDGGDDAYQATGFAQGAGTFGTGLLVDAGGSDKAVVQGRGQGFGSTFGLGALLDLGGDDQRRLGLPGRDAADPDAGGGQGAGWGTRPFPWTDDVALHGGVGLLYDRAGDDTYYGRDSSQGSGWFLGLGLLLERAGNDRYLGEERSQGSASHLAAGILIDSGGADAYTGVRGVQGAADDRALGLLWDRGTDSDGYSVGPGTDQPGRGRDGQGFARHARALGILVDDGGDDAYTAERDAQGEILLPARPGAPPHALFLDLGGTDRYEKAARRPGSNPADGAAWSSEDLAAGIDTTADAVGFPPPDIPAAPGPATWTGSVEPSVQVPATTDPAATTYALLEARLRAVVGAPGGVDGDEPVTSSDVRVVRLAARVQALRGDIAGIDALVRTLDRRTEDHSGRGSPGALLEFLRSATGLNHGWDIDAWRTGWRDAREGHDLEARLPALRALQRARFAARDRDGDALLSAVEEAVATAPPGDRSVRIRAARLAATFAGIVGDPESHRHHDPDLARRLSEAAILWSPSSVGAFLEFARASMLLGDPESAARALEKVALADPDHPELDALRLQLADAP